MPGPHHNPGDDNAQHLWRLAGMGATMASEILAGAAIGWGLDKLFKTQPTLLIVFTVIGVVVGMGTFIRRALRETQAASREAKQVIERGGLHTVDDDDARTDDT